MAFSDDGRERADGGGEVLEHELGEAHVVEHRDVAAGGLLVDLGRGLGVAARGLVGQVDGLQQLERRVVVAEQHVGARQRDEAEVSELLDDLGRGLGALLLAEDLHDLGVAHQRVQVAEHLARVPDEEVLLVGRDLGLALGGHLGAVLAVRLVLVHELAHDVEDPLRGQRLELERAVQHAVEDGHVRLPGRHLHVHGRLQAREEVAEVDLLVQQQEGRVLVHERLHGAGLGPRGLLEVVVGQVVELAVVQARHLRHVARDQDEQEVLPVTPIEAAQAAEAQKKRAAATTVSSV
ncbi:hypothetical protein ON010_g8488 [Phytophthora cinnamomi]|nr:hypothetical protein ON010_g8488 [Phytophthora cinnamomi]